jgi:hypothetical protein
MFEGLMGSLLSLLIMGAIILGFSAFVAKLLIWIFGTEDAVVEASAVYEPSIEIQLRRAA